MLKDELLKWTNNEFILMKGKFVEAKLKNGRKHKGVVESLVEASISYPSHLIAAMVINGIMINIAYIESLEIIKIWKWRK